MRRDWPRDARSHSVRDTRSRNDDGAGCTTQLDNTHGTGFRKLLYRWHPWFGLPVFIHQAIDKPDDVVFRCTLSGSDAARWLEIPAWMFDRAACANDSAELPPEVQGMLTRLMAQLILEHADKSKTAAMTEVDHDL